MQIAFALFSKQVKTCNEIPEIISLSVSFNSTMHIEVEQVVRQAEHKQLHIYKQTHY